MPGAGVEPARLAPADFKSASFTNLDIRALFRLFQSQSSKASYTMLLKVAWAEPQAAPLAALQAASLAAALAASQAASLAAAQAAALAAAVS